MERRDQSCMCSGYECYAEQIVMIRLFITAPHRCCSAQEEGVGTDYAADTAGHRKEEAFH